MREQMFVLGVAVLGICIIFLGVIASYLIRLVMPEDPAASVERQLAVAPVIDAVLDAYKRTGDKPVSACPLCKQSIQIRVRTSQRLVRLDCPCEACNGTYQVTDSKFPLTVRA